MTLPFARENEFLVVYLPPISRALVFRIVGVYNNGYQKIEYGPIPISAGTTLPTYEGGATTVPEDGVMPARSYTRDAVRFPMEGAYDESDMWRFPEDWNERLFHILQVVKPGFLRIEAQIPPGAIQPKFQRDKVLGGVEKDFGFTRGKFEIVQLPGVSVGYRYGNDTNLDVYTYVRFYYAEYMVEIVKDAEMVYNILMKRVPSRWYTYPVTYLHPRIIESLKKAYGFEGFPLLYRREEAVKRYEELIQLVRR